MTTITALCSYPVGSDADPCRRPAVARYVRRGEDLWRCKKHDSRIVQAKAEDMGFERLPLEKAAA